MDAVAPFPDRRRLWRELAGCGSLAGAGCSPTPRRASVFSRRGAAPDAAMTWRPSSDRADIVDPSSEAVDPSSAEFARIAARRRSPTAGRGGVAASTCGDGRAGGSRCSPARSVGPGRSGGLPGRRGVSDSIAAEKRAPPDPTVGASGVAGVRRPGSDGEPSGSSLGTGSLQRVSDAGRITLDPARGPGPRDRCCSGPITDLFVKEQQIRLRSLLRLDIRRFKLLTE